ncbi:recombinase family protein, partial [Aquamicrobium segne]
MMIGYARVSTQGQDLDQQRAALSAAGCIRIFEEKVSGAKRNRPELARMLDYLQPGNVVAITRLGVVCGRGRNPTLRLWPAIFAGEV